MKLINPSVFLHFYFLASICTVNVCEAQAQQNVPRLFQTSSNLLGNLTLPGFQPKFETRLQSPARVQSRSRRDPIGSLLIQSLSKLVKLLLPDINVMKPLRQAFQRSEESARSFAICQACKIVMSTAVDHFRHSRTPNSLLKIAERICPLIPLELDDCRGIIREYGEIFIHIVQIRPYLPPDRMCGMYFQFYGCETSDPNIYWDVLAEMGYSSRVRNGSSNYGTANLDDKSTIKILQLTDIHLDPLYRPGSRAKCRSDLCCRGEEVPEKEFQAGYFGDFRYCDLPIHTFENALAHIAETHPDISMIYMTGDLAPHIGFGRKSSKEIVEDVVITCSEIILKYFPNTPVIPVIGNHDVHPRNLFTPSSVENKFSTRWVYEVTAKAWAQWLTPEILETFSYAGFYSKIINPQFRIIVLNNNVCLGTNFWQSIEDRDQNGQLHWLVTELQEAEDSNQNVHILGHIPPNFETCWNVWSENYYGIIARFSHIVKAQFFAHTHHDDFGLYYDPIERNRPISSYYVGAALTPYVKMNPGYKIYTVDGARGPDSTYDILDHETWIFNLTEANLTPEVPPKWFRLYKAKELYGLENLSPSQLHSFVMRMSSNETEFKEFYRYFSKASAAKKWQSCDSMCRKSRLCNIVSPNFKEYGRCMLLENPNSKDILPNAIFSTRSIRTGFPGPPLSEPWAGFCFNRPIVGKETPGNLEPLIQKTSSVLRISPIWLNELEQSYKFSFEHQFGLLNQQYVKCWITPERGFSNLKIIWAKLKIIVSYGGSRNSNTKAQTLPRKH
ncbi:unnamed protein product [Allacma fusca]|uniref:Saposin B-type domain-containing protein n=1 Tax=Allacma fusca TaxID=39272 RepID=A0A8J2KY12_9HEXA|nr:unnamed protein product [Allacma fusca]